MNALIKDGQKGIVSSDNIMHHSYFKNQSIYVLLSNDTRISPHLKFVWV